MSGGFRSSFPTVVNEWRFCSSFPPHRPLMIGGFSIVLERVAIPHTFGRGKRPVNERVSAAHLRNERVSASHLGNERISAAPTSDDRRLFNRFRTSGGSAYVWERKTPRERANCRHPSRERANCRHPSRERASFRHSFEARGQTPASSQNEGEESIAGGAYKPYKRMVSPGARISEMRKKRLCPLL